MLVFVCLRERKRERQQERERARERKNKRKQVFQMRSFKDPATFEAEGKSKIHCGIFRILRLGQNPEIEVVGLCLKIFWISKGNFVGTVKAKEREREKKN